MLDSVPDPGQWAVCGFCDGTGDTVGGRPCVGCQGEGFSIPRPDPFDPMPSRVDDHAADPPGHRGAEALRNSTPRGKAVKKPAGSAKARR